MPGRPRRPHLPRTRRGRALAGAGGAVAVAGAVYGVFTLVAGASSPAALTLSPNSSPAAQVSSGSVAGTWTVGSGSVAGYRVRERLAVLPAPSDAVGRTSAITGQASVVDSAGTDTVTAVDVTVDVSTLSSDKPMRDQRVHTMGLQTDTYPTATFALSRPFTLPAGATGGRTVRMTATGALTLHGVTRTVSIPLTLRLSGAGFEVVGSITFPWSEFGMTAPSFGDFVQVTGDPTMELDLHLAHAAS